MPTKPDRWYGIALVIILALGTLALIYQPCRGSLDKCYGDIQQLR